MDGDNLLRRSQPAGPLDDDNLLAEILLRLPPQPSSLPRASLVCHRWRRLVSDNGFLRRFRLHHRRNPPLLGCFSERRLELSFMPMLEAPNRVPAIRPARAAQGGGLNMSDIKGFHVLGCRHGLVLICIPSRNQVLVWDPVTGDQHRIALPLGFDAKKTYMDGAVLRSAAGDDHHFQVILICDDQEHTRVVACVYSSETDEWCNSISILVPFYVTGDAAVLGGDSLYWLLGLDNLVGILEIDFKRQSLAVIQLPMDNDKFSLMRAEGGGLGLFFLSDLGAQLWKRKTDSGGVASWELGRTLELNELKTPSGLNSLMIEGFAEDNNVVFLSRDSTFFMVQLEPLELKELSEVDNLCFYYPFESVYTAGMGICGGHGGAEHLHNA